MKPMLASPANLEALVFPLFASVKLDGVRAIITDKGALSRSLKPIPNMYVQRQLKQMPPGLDGELIVGLPDSSTVYRTTVSGVMSEDGEPEFTYYVFDTFLSPDKPYNVRARALDGLPLPAKSLPQQLIHELDELLDFEQKMLGEGYEGLILRSLNAPYKFGRSTTNEGFLLKLKRFEDSEAVVIGFEELMHNANEAKKNALGRTERSSHKENKHGLDTLGALICKWNDLTFNIGTGFTAAERAEIWKNRKKYLGALTKFKYFTVGMKDAPRHPVWLGWRNPKDL